MDEIKTIFERIESERVVAFLGVCYSGAAGGRTFASLKTRAGSVGDMFLERLTRSKGRAIITASRPTEVSIELTELGHGIFTYYLVQGLQGGRRRQPRRHRESSGAVRVRRAAGGAEVPGRRRQSAPGDEGRDGRRPAARPGAVAPAVSRGGGRALALAVVIALLAAAPAQAQSPTEDMQQYTDQVVRLIRDVTVREKDTLGAPQTAVARMALQVFGAPEAARVVLGPHWNARTPAEREEFTQLFAELLEATYLSQIDTMGGVKIRSVGEIVEATGPRSARGCSAVRPRT